MIFNSIAFHVVVGGVTVVVPLTGVFGCFYNGAPKRIYNHNPLVYDSQTVQESFYYFTVLLAAT